MIVVNDLCGDEGDNYIGCQVLTALLQNAIYEALIDAANTKIKGCNSINYADPVGYILGSVEII